MPQPTDAAVGADGSIYALDLGGIIYRLDYRLDPDGGIVTHVNLAPFAAYSPRGLAIDSSPDRLYVRRGRARWDATGG